MPAIPAWPPAGLPRLFVDQPLADGANIRIEGGQAHYLLGVMRLKPGARIKLFDDISGEWLGEIASVGKRDLILQIIAHLRPRDPLRPRHGRVRCGDR